MKHILGILLLVVFVVSLLASLRWSLGGDYARAAYYMASASVALLSMPSEGKR